MYLTAQHSGRRTRLAGAATAALATLGAALVFSFGVQGKHEAKAEPRTELMFIEAPEPQKVLPLPEIKEVEVKTETPPPELLAPPIEITPEVEPVIIAPPAPADAVTPAPIAASDRTAPKLRVQDKPPYPAQSLRASEEGTTHLEVCVTHQGRVQSVSVVGSSGHSRLDQAAARWLRSARFEPGTIRGVPQAMCGHDIYYQWKLTDAR